MSENAIAKVENNNVVAGFSNSLSFDFMQRQATMLASSALMPKDFSIVGVLAAEKPQKIANVMIALEMANRIGASPMMVAQNLYIVHGKPSWSSTFIIAAINGCGRFNAMKFEMFGAGDDLTCIAIATEKGTGEKLESPPVSIAMAKAEGWYQKSGSKWKTMPELMLRYRAATLFGRLYAPEILMGMRSVEELDDIDTAPEPDKKLKKVAVMERFTAPATETIDPVKTADIDPMTAEEKAEVAPPETPKTDLQSVYALLTKLAQLRGETPDDMIDTLTNGRIGSLIDLEDKPEPFIFDIALMLQNEIKKG